MGRLLRSALQHGTVWRARFGKNGDMAHSAKIPAHSAINLLRTRVAIWSASRRRLELPVSPPVANMYDDSNSWGPATVNLRRSTVVASRVTDFDFPPREIAQNFHGVWSAEPRLP